MYINFLSCLMSAGKSKCQGRTSGIKPMKMYNPARFLIICMIIHFLMMGCSFSGDVSAKSLTGLRDCVVWLRASTDKTIKITWEDVYASDSNTDHICFQSPDGKLIDHIILTKGDTGGSRVLRFSEGSGDYRLEIPGYFHRNVRVDLPDGMPVVIEPAKSYFSMRIKKGAFLFNIPTGIPSFTLCGKYYEGPRQIYLYDPGNNLKGILSLKDHSETLAFDTLEIKSPEKGEWHIEFKETGKVSFWVDGIPNLFAKNPDDLFIPELQNGVANFTGTGVTGKMGLIGAYSVSSSDNARVLEHIRYMGIKSLNYYVDHEWREPFNPDFPDGGDNGDPSVIDPGGFNWKDKRIDFFRNQLGTEISVLFSSNKSWLGTPLSSQRQKEFAEFVLACIAHYNAETSTIRWISPWDEPNLKLFTYDEYASLLKEVATRIKAPENPYTVRNTNILAISSSGFDGINSGEDRIGLAWARRLYSAYDNLVEGIAFDLWDHFDLIESKRFRDAVSQAEEIITDNDMDGNRDEQIVINQTSMSSGKGSSAYSVNTHFGALWLTGAICNAFASGRLNAFHYFTTVDDSRHMKGLIYSDTLPPALPYQEQKQPYDVKPIGHAMAMINRTVLDKVIVLKYDSLEVDSLLTISDDGLKAGLVVVNKSPRMNRCKINALLPGKTKELVWGVSGLFYDSSMKAPVPLPETQPLAVSGGLFTFEKDLAPETVYVFSLKNSD
jgi:hypothetical protein